MKTNTFKTFIEENYYDSICTRLNGFISTHPSFIKEKINASVNVHHPELEDFTIEAVYIESGNDNKIEFDIVCNCNVNYEYVEYHGKYKNHDSDCMSDVWVVVHGRTSLSNLKKVYFYGAEEYVKNAIHKPLNGDMVPIIRSSEYAQYAIDIIRKYYGQDYDLTVPINIKELANKMGLEVKHLKPEFSFKKNEAIFGQIYFEKTHTQIYNKETDTMVDITIPANTIVYDPNSYFMSNIEKENNNTIIHECVHFYLHRYAIKFQKIFDKKYKWFDCDINGRANMNLGMDINIMEWQANALTPRILMPYKAFSEEAFKLIKEFRLKNNSDTIDILPNVIETLSNLYHVSKLSVKIRLCDIGVTEAYGCDIWCDDYKVPDFSFEPGTCEYNETFVIPAIDAIALSSNPIISKMMEEQKLVYLESHLCLNSEKYIGKDLYGKKYIKYEARKKLNKFCIKMKMTIVNFDSCYERECLLNRNRNSKFHTKLCFEGKEKDIFTEANIMKILEEERKFNNAFFDLNNDYVTCMKMLKEKSGLTYEQIEAETEIELSSVKNIIAGKRNGSLLRLTLILMAIGAEPDSAYHVIDKSGVRLDRDNAEHQLCRFIINTMHADTMENIIKCVNNANFKI